LIPLLYHLPSCETVPLTQVVILLTLIKSKTEPVDLFSSDEGCVNTYCKLLTLVKAEPVDLSSSEEGCVNTGCKLLTLIKTEQVDFSSSEEGCVNTGCKLYLLTLMRRQPLKLRTYYSQPLGRMEENLGNVDG